MMGYLANTVIFVLVGVVISERAFRQIEEKDCIFLVALYFGIIVIRGGYNVMLTVMKNNYFAACVFHVTYAYPLSNLLLPLFPQGSSSPASPQC